MEGVVQQVVTSTASQVSGARHLINEIKKSGKRKYSSGEIKMNCNHRKYKTGLQKTQNLIRKFQILFCVLCMTFLCPLWLIAEEVKITLNGLIREAKENNPEIKALTQKFLASKQWPVVVRTMEYPQIGFEKKEKEQEEIFYVSQMFPFLGKLSLRGRVAEYESEITRQKLNSKIREVLAGVRKSYWSYWFIHKTIEIYQENIDLMKNFLNIAKTQYTIGKVTQTDILKANTELADMERMLIMLEQEKTSTQAELNALLNRAPDTFIGKPAQPEKREIKYSQEELENMALKNRPELLAKESLYKRNITEVNLAKLEWFPDIMGGIKSSNMGNKTYMVQASIPIYFWKQRSIVRAMKKEKEMAEWELQTTKVTTLQVIKDLWTKYDAHRKSVQIYETSIVPLAEQTLIITESGYRTGKNDFLDLLDSQKRYLSYNIDYYRHIVESQIYLIDLERVVGVDFQ